MDCNRGELISLRKGREFIFEVQMFYLILNDFYHKFRRKCPVWSVCGVCVAQPNNIVHKGNGGSMWFKLPRLEMIVPEAHMGACMELATQRRGIYRCSSRKTPTDRTTGCFVGRFLYHFVLKSTLSQKFWSICKSLIVWTAWCCTFPGQPTS